ncbi:hypothetical protein [Nocardiopsis sp. MG754419]|nr:hypothetical protein [Nocardiopsis sp. MG754419]
MGVPVERSPRPSRPEGGTVSDRLSTIVVLVLLILLLAWFDQNVLCP